MEPKDAGPLGIHFQKLLDLKKWVKEQSEKSKDPLINEIYEKLHALIKEEGLNNE